MPSQKLASGENLLKGELAAAWNILEGSSGDYTDLGIARRFGAAAAAYSLRDIGAMNGRVVRVRRNSDDTEEDFSANQVQSGVVENFCNEILTVGVAVEGGSGASRPDSFTNATNSSFTATVTEVAGGYFPYKTGAGDVITISFDLVLSGDASPSACTSTNVSTVNNASNSIAYTASGSYTSSFTCTTDGTHIRFADGDDGTFAVTNFTVTSHISNGLVETWYDQSGSGRDAVQITATEQPSIVKNGGIVKVNGKPAIDFDGVDNYFDLPTNLNFNLDPSSATRPVNTIMFVGQNDAGNRSFLGTLGSTKNWIGNPYVGRYQLRDNSSNIYDTGTTATTGSQVVTSFQCPSEDNFTIRENGSALTLGGTNNITANISISDIGAGYTANYQTMKAQEFSFYKERLTNDIVDIENDAINYYNI